MLLFERRNRLAHQGVASPLLGICVRAAPRRADGLPPECRFRESFLDVCAELFRESSGWRRSPDRTAPGQVATRSAAREASSPMQMDRCRRSRCVARVSLRPAARSPRLQMPSASGPFANHKGAHHWFACPKWGMRSRLRRFVESATVPTPQRQTGLALRRSGDEDA